jgi:hypothetical protein
VAIEDANRAETMADWPELPDAIRVGIIAMVNTALPER